MDSKKIECQQLNDDYAAFIAEVKVFFELMKKVSAKDKVAKKDALALKSKLTAGLEKMEKYSAWNRWLGGQQSYEPEMPKEVAEKTDYECKIHDELLVEALVLRARILPGEKIGLIADNKILVRDESTGKYSRYLTLPDEQVIGNVFFLKNKKMAVHAMSQVFVDDEFLGKVTSGITHRLSFCRQDPATGKFEVAESVPLPDKTVCCEVSLGGKFHIATSNGEILVMDEQTGKKTWKRVFQEKSLGIREMKVLPNGFFISGIDVSTGLPFMQTIALAEDGKYARAAAISSQDVAGALQYSAADDTVYGKVRDNIVPVGETNTVTDKPMIADRERLLQVDRLSHWKMLPDSRIITVSESEIKIWGTNDKGNYNVIDTLEVFDQWAQRGWRSPLAVMRDGRIVCTTSAGKVDIYDGVPVK